MNFRLANLNDLDFLKKMYNDVIKAMYENNVKIWNEYYPIGVLAEEIEANRLYVLENDREIIGACTLCDSNEGEAHVKWSEETKNVFYINMLAINAKYMRQGIAGILLEKVKDFAKQKGINFIRLFVVDSNQPAINLYLKSGYSKVEGVYKEQITEDFSLTEYGFELEVV
ncbi:MAG: GNAT family N-acetyltransferase [Clostridia bacterium]|nr:GNAT family N-acetyltransferase [Clostridia bacterium]